jgi:carbamate kinase
VGPIRALVDAGVVVIAAGGGGVPVIETADGGYKGVEAVIDKDLGSVILAQAIGARRLAIITAVERVALDFGTPNEHAVDRLTLSEAHRFLAEGHFPPGSMGPKILGAIRFLETGGDEVLITSPDHLAEGLAGRAGTRIVP